MGSDLRRPAADRVSGLADWAGRHAPVAAVGPRRYRV